MHRMTFFYQDDHVERLFKTAEQIKLTIPVSREEIKAIVEEGIKKSTFDDVWVKVEDNFVYNF